MYRVESEATVPVRMHLWEGLWISSIPERAKARCDIVFISLQYLNLGLKMRPCTWNKKGAVVQIVGVHNARLRLASQSCYHVSAYMGAAAACVKGRGPVQSSRAKMHCPSQVQCGNLHRVVALLIDVSQNVPTDIFPTSSLPFAIISQLSFVEVAIL